MDMKLKTKIKCFIVINLMLLTLLYCIPIDLEELNTLCIFKRITGKNCWNCGMTRAFLSILHGEYELAINYNWKCIFVFPLTIIIYLYSWYKFIIKNDS